MSVPENGAGDPLRIARRLLAVPTAPFHEDGVMACLRGLLAAAGVPFRADRHGNLIARHRRGRGPRWALVAHTDHPGIEVTSVRGTTARATVHGTFLGGVLPEALPGTRVRLHGPDGAEAGGVIRTVRMVRGEKRVAIDLEGPAVGQALGIGPGAFGAFDLGGPRADRRRISAVAVDDLIGCATIVAVLAAARAEGLPGRIDGVFTRAEEVGFVGTQLLAEDGALDGARIVSLEASRELPGAWAGRGPVLRTGDRTTVFHSGLEHHLHAVAKDLEARVNGFAFQRQLMSGGTCEATVFTAHGLQATGLAYPLLNYHNVTPEGGIGREEVATADYLNGIRLLTEAVRRGGADATFPRYLRDLRKSTGRYRRRLPA
jgi:putative aminopeptidase FrvX